MTHEKQDPKISQDALNDYGRRQYKKFDASKANVNRRLGRRYGYNANGSRWNRMLRVAVAVGILLAAWWCLRPQLSGVELELSQLLAQQTSPLPTTVESTMRSDDVIQSDTKDAITAYEKGDYDGAVSAFELLDVELLNAKQRLFYGHALFQLERYEKAIWVLDRESANEQDAYRDISTDRQIAYWTAKSYAATNRCDLALVALQKITPPSEDSEVLTNICREIIRQP